MANGFTSENNKSELRSERLDRNSEVYIKILKISSSQYCIPAQGRISMIPSFERLPMKLTVANHMIVDSPSPQPWEKLFY